MIPQGVVKDVGGTIWIEPRLDSLPTAATLAIIDGGNTARVAAGTSATVSTISTTLNGAISSGATSLVVASATGIAEGSEIALRAPFETVTVKAVSGTTVTTWHPISYDHATGATVDGMRISYDVTAAQATPLWWDGRAVWTLTVGGATVQHVSSVECVEYGLERVANLQDVYRIHPEFHYELASVTNVDAWMDGAHGQVLDELGSRGRARTWLGDETFVEAVALCALYRHYRSQASDRAQVLYERYREEYQAAMSRAMENTPNDADQDGSVEPGEQTGFSNIPIGRG